jgi:hypothetical protein
MKKMLIGGYQILMSSSGLATVFNYGSGSDFLASYSSGSSSGSARQKVPVPTVPVPQHWLKRREESAVYALRAVSCRIIFRIGGDNNEPTAGGGGAEEAGRAAAPGT